MRSSFRGFHVVAFLILLSVFAPRPVRAQGFGLSGGWAPGGSNTFRFSFTGLPSGPVSVNYLSLVFGSPGWSFTGTTYSGADPFSPAGFGPFALAVFGPSQVDFDFVSDLGWFEINSGFVSFLDVTGLGSGSTTFTYSGLASDGTSLQGQGQLNAPLGVVPEPATVVLLATGLLGIAALVRRKKARLS